MTLILSNDEIEAAVPMTAYLEALETTFEELGAGRAITSSREDVLTPVRDPPAGTTDPVYHGLKTMGGVVPAFDLGAIRINSDVIHWPRRNGDRVREKLPAADGRYTGLVWLFSTRTGEPLAIFPDGIVQASRVGATSALGAKYLARPGSSRLGLYGAGFQARAHLRALDAVFDLETVTVYAPTPASREEFAAELADEVAPAIEPVDDPRAVCRDADIVQGTTNATTPVFDFDWIEPGTHVGVIRNYEAPPAFFEVDRFDVFAQSWHPITIQEELGDQLVPRHIPTKNVENYIVESETGPVPKFANARDEPLCDWDAVASLADVIAGRAPGRTEDDGLTGFYNEGLGIQFVAAGRAVLDAAAEHDLGRDLETALFTEEYHP